MPDIKFVFVGYRKEWERDWVVERAGDTVQVLAIPTDPTATILERGRELAAQADVLAVWGYPLANLHLNPGNLKLVRTLASGTNGVPKAELRELGILTANNGGANSVAVAELTVLLIIAALRRLSFLLDNLKTGRYKALLHGPPEVYLPLLSLAVTPESSLIPACQVPSFDL